MSTIFGVLVCLSPLIFMVIGYVVGRYGLPIEVRRRRLRDRRPGRDQVAGDGGHQVEESEVEIFTAQGG